MEEDILSQEDDVIEEEMNAMEKKVVSEKSEVASQVEQVPDEVIRETWEAFEVKSRMGITNTVNGETIDGFDSEKDAALVTALKMMFNKLDKIAIATGA